MTCDCIIQTNKALEERGEYLALSKGFARIQIGTQLRWVPKFETKKEGGAKGTPIIANFCPFCGKKVDLEAKI